MTSAENFAGDAAPVDIWDGPPIPIELRDEYIASRNRRILLDSAREALPEAQLQIGSQGCDAACVAYIDTLVGNRPTSPSDVDAVFGRAPDAALNPVSADLWLLDRGVRVDLFEPKTADGEVMQQFMEGRLSLEDFLIYAEGVFGAPIPEAYRARHIAYYKSLRLEHGYNKPRSDAYVEAGSLVKCDDVPITFELVSQLAEEGKIVKCYLTSERYSGASHAVLIFSSPISSDLLLYNPAVHPQDKNYNIGLVTPEIPSKLCTEQITAYY